MKSDNNTYTSTPNTTMFSKIHQTQKFQPYPTTTTTPVFHHSSEETGSPTTTNAAAVKTETSNDGASIEISRRPRGRPPGSKNKPKPPIIITRDPDPAMSPYVLEIPPGNDVVASLNAFCRRRHSGICILNGSGTVANVTIKQPSSTPGATVTFHGRFDVLSLSGSVLPSFSGQVIGCNFTISLAGPQGQIVGGAVVGPLMSAGTVFVVAASFNNPTYHRLPLEEENNNNNNNNNGGGEVVRSPVSGDSGQGEMGMYSSCQLPSDVVWAPTPRQGGPY